MELYEVGGCVRDEILGVPNKDIDFTVVLDPAEVTPRRTRAGKLLERSPFQVMDDELVRRGFEVFVRSPQYLTIRARFPRMNHPKELIGRDYRNLTADFVLARKEGEYTDGRRPDKVEPGTLEDDLRRRDFTVNAIAKSLVTGEIIDPFNGRRDLEYRQLVAVGSAEDRFREDALRAVRALRFSITKGLRITLNVSDALRSEWLPPLLGTISVERRREELLKAFRWDTLATFDLLALQTPAFREALFAGGLRLEPTLKS